MLPRRLRSEAVLCALAGLAGCIEPDLSGVRRLDAGDASVLDAGDGSVPPTPDIDMAADQPPSIDQPTADTGDSGSPPPDVVDAECTPRAIGCSADNRSIRTCNDQGRWMTTGACPASAVCSAGVCLCPGSCADDPIAETTTTGMVADLAGGGRYLYLSVNGPASQIRRYDLTARTDTVVKSGGADITVFAIDSDESGDLLWCSTVNGSTGELVHGTQPLETGACSHVRRRDGVAYFKGDVLYRKALAPGAPLQTVTGEPMVSFEIAGDQVYFVGELAGEAFLKRVSLGDTSKVDTITRRKDASFLRLMPDASHVYLISQGHILRVAQTVDAQPEMFWAGTGPEAWDMVQTDSHVYWTASTSSNTGCSETQILRRPKAGGPVATLSRTPGHCAGPLARVGEHLYTAVWTAPPAPSATRILRIRP